MRHTLSALLLTAALTPVTAPLASCAGRPNTLTHAPSEIGNEALIVQWNAATAAFSVTDRASGKVVIKDGRLEGIPGLVQVGEEAANDPVFGKGRRLVLSANPLTSLTQAPQPHRSVSLEVYPNLPFVLVRETISNTTGQRIDVPKAVPATFTLDLGKPAAELKTLGTGGLLPPDKNPGSYLFLTGVDPASRNGVVAGWLTQNRGSGVVFSTVDKNAVAFKAQIDYGHLCIPAGQSAALETLAVGYFPDARLGEEAYADAVKKQYAITLRAPDAVYCSWYAEKHGLAGDEKSTVDLARFAARELKPYGFGVVQIDDEWQDGPKTNGPRRGFERVRPDGPYANGIAPVAAEVEKAGLTFGLWWLPFGRNCQDPEYKDRQHWFVKREDGKPYDTPWGGTCLDLTHPEVRKHLSTLAKLYRSWGVKYYKMDGLWTGAACEQIYVNDGYRDDHLGNTQPFHDPAVNNVEAYRSGLKLIRDNAGGDVFFSGCCISQNMRELTAIGLVDSMRVGPDASGDIRVGPIRGTRLYFMNGRIWWNDPDPAVTRAAGSFMGVNPVSRDEARLTTSWVALSGQFFLVSDWLPDLPPERIDILKRTMAHHNGTARPVDAFDRELPGCWLLTDEASGVRRDVIGLFNFDRTPLVSNDTCLRLGLKADVTYHAFDFWDNQPLPDFKDQFNATAAPRTCRVIAVREACGHPVLVSTSRHVSSGILEVKKEQWQGQTLSGISEVVGNDPYELRIVGLKDGKDWHLARVSVGAEDAAAGVRIAAQPATADGWLRVKIDAPQHRQVRWAITFD